MSKMSKMAEEIKRWGWVMNIDDINIIDIKINVR